MDLMTTTMPAGHPHGAMRREDREITDRATMDAILQRGNLMHLALCDQEVPFLVPVFYLVVRTLFKGKKKDGADAGPDVLGNDSHKEISAS